MKKILAIVLSLLLCWSISACTAGGEAEIEPPAPPVKIEVEPEAPPEKQPEPEHEEQPAPPAPEEPQEPVITEINHYVLTPADKLYLTDDRMDAYKKALDAIFAHAPEVQLTDSYDDNLAVFGYLRQSPYTFLLSDYDITADHKGMYFEYAYPAEECTRMIGEIDGEYLTLLNETITADMTELEKVLAIHHYFAQRISYDYDWLDGLNMADDKFLYPDIVVYQALQTNLGVCHTYTYLCEFAFQQLGIDCVRATADLQDSDDGHMWPLVWIDGTPFHIDPTWDKEGDAVTLRYFGMTDEENIHRGLVDNWSVSIDMGLDIQCTDTRFEGWRDFLDYELLGNHQMRVTKDDGTTEIIDLTNY